MLAVVGVLAVPAAASAAPSEYFFEETAQANWSVPYQCASGATVQARLLVESTRDYFAPDTEDADPTARAQFQAVCPDGTSFGWLGFGSVTIASTPNLKSVAVDTPASTTITVREPNRTTHQVTVDVDWTGSGALETTVSPSQGFLVGTSTIQERSATATGTVTYDGQTLVDGAANHRITPFIRTDDERYTTTG